MRLVNTTVVAASLVVTSSGDPDVRIARLLAKATFTMPGVGAGKDATRPRLAPEHAVAIFEQDMAVDDTTLPADGAATVFHGFEVILLGSARTRDQRPVHEMQVGLALGPWSRTLDVVGDRQWRATPLGTRATEPVPFTTMPLCWSRAFGGTARVWLDAHSMLPVSDPINPDGRGFDPRGRAQQLSTCLATAPGYPVVEHDARLPNLEDPQRRIRRPDDVVLPTCWATTPRNLGLAVLVDAAAEGVPHVDPIGPWGWRCHPAWHLPDVPSEATPCRITGVAHDGPIAFDLPMLRIVADVAAGTIRGTLELVATRLILRPDVGLFHVGYCGHFTVPPPDGTPRSARLRLS